MKTMPSGQRLQLDLSTGQLLAGEKTIDLTPKTFLMLRYFVLNPNRLLSKQELLDEVWPDTYVTESLVKDYVRKIRGLLDDDASRPRFVETARGRGYRFVGDIIVSSAIKPPNDTKPARHALPSIAVLAFSDLSDSRDQAYLASGIAEEILAELSRFRSLLVIARDSSFLYDGESTEIDRVSNELHAEYLVRGSLRRAEDRVRIHVQLLEASSFACVWAERYDLKLDDLFGVLDQVTKAIVATLVGHLDEHGRQRAARKKPAGLAVYEYLLLGNWHLRQGGEEDILEAREMFRRAIELEPESARAHAELAFSYLIEFWSDWTNAPKVAADSAIALASKAIALDSLDSRAHLYLAAAYHYGASNFEAADLAYGKAIRLNPNDYDAFCLRSWLLALSGHGEQGIVCAEQAIRLSPLTTEDCRVAQCFAAYGARRYDAALAALQCIAEPTNNVIACLAMCYAQLGQMKKARRAMADFLTRAHDEIADCPGSEGDGWWRYWTTRYPFQKAEDRDHMLEGLLKAGLPMDQSPTRDNEP